MLIWHNAFSFLSPNLLWPLEIKLKIRVVQAPIYSPADQHSCPAWCGADLLRVPLVPLSGLSIKVLNRLAPILNPTELSPARGNSWAQSSRQVFTQRTVHPCKSWAFPKGKSHCKCESCYWAIWVSRGLYSALSRLHSCLGNISKLCEQQISLWTHQATHSVAPKLWLLAQDKQVASCNSGIPPVVCSLDGFVSAAAPWLWGWEVPAKIPTNLKRLDSGRKLCALAIVLMCVLRFKPTWISRLLFSKLKAKVL